MPLSKVRSVACDRGSRTSVALTRVILDGFYKNRPTFRESDPDPAQMLVESDAALLIGDIALQFKKDNKYSTSFMVGNYGQEGPQAIQVFDLVERWNSLTGLPFVFAFWTARQGFSEHAVVEQLVDSRAFGLANLDHIAARYAQSLKLDKDFLLQYLEKNMDYNMDQYGVEALHEFYALAVRAGAIKRARGIEFL